MKHLKKKFVKKFVWVLCLAFYSVMRKYLEVRVLPFEKSISWVTDFSGQQKQQQQQQQAPVSPDSAIPLEKSRLSVSSLALDAPLDIVTLELYKTFMN